MKAPSVDSAVAPSAEELEAMGRHLAEEHAAGFDPAHDVSYERHLRLDAPLTYRPPSVGQGPGFWCRRCPAKVFVLGEPTRGTPERNAFLRRTERQELSPLLARQAPADQEELIEAYDRGELGDAALAYLRRRRAMASPKRERPKDLRRIERSISYLLWRYPQVGTVEAAIDELRRLRESDPDFYRELIGSLNEYEFNTFQSYWKQIPLELREAARREMKALPEGESRGLARARRVAKLNR